MTRFRLHEDGTFDVLDGRRLVLARAFAQDRENHLRTTQRSGESTLCGSNPSGEIELLFQAENLFVRITNQSSAPIAIRAVDVLCCDAANQGVMRFGDARALRYLHHGWQSWSQTAIRRMTEPEIPYDGDDFLQKHLPYGAAAFTERTSNAFTLIAQSGQERAVLFGFPSHARQFSQIRFSVQDDEITALHARVYGDGVPLAPGETFESEPLAVRFGDAGALYHEYARRVGENMGRRGARDTLQGWCSWYYYYGENSADDVRANLQAITANDLPLDVVVIDDGYATAIGDWTSINATKYPEGMKKIADEIHAAGKLAGIWLAPFGASSDSRLAQQHPEFLLTDEHGARVLAWTHTTEPVYALDLTRPDVHAWLRELFHTICHVWGYDLVKLDFAFAGALPGKHLDPMLTRAQAYRRGLAVIAETVGADKLILGCGAPQLASVGLVDAMRVSHDIHFTWEPSDPANTGSVSTQFAVQNTLLRAPFNQRCWLNDPDCMIVRKYGELNAMTRSEMRTLASVATLTGSLLLDSDNLETLATEHLNDLRRCLPALARTARVRQWFSGGQEQPCELELELADGRRILAVINWRDRARETTIQLPDDAAYAVYDFWNKKFLGVHRARMRIPRHAPHQTVVLHCAPVANEARVIASSFHLGGADIGNVLYSKGRLRIEKNPTALARGEILVWLPPHKSLKRALVGGKHARARPLRANLFAMPVLSRDAQSIEIEF